MTTLNVGRKAKYVVGGRGGGRIHRRDELEGISVAVGPFLSLRVDTQFPRRISLTGIGRSDLKMSDKISLDMQMRGLSYTSLSR